MTENVYGHEIEITQQPIGFRGSSLMREHEPAVTKYKVRILMDKSDVTEEFLGAGNHSLSNSEAMERVKAILGSR